MKTVQDDFNYAYITVARKNGKTTLMAGCALAALFFDQEKAAEVYFAATKKDQAKIGFDEAQRMVSISPQLRRHLRAGKHDYKSAKALSAMHVPEQRARYTRRLEYTLRRY